MKLIGVEIPPPVGSLIRPRILYGDGEDSLLVFNDNLEKVAVLDTDDIGVVLSISGPYVTVLAPGGVVGYALVTYLDIV